MRTPLLITLAFGLSTGLAAAQDLIVSGDGIRVDQMTGGPVYSLGSDRTLTPGAIFDTIETTWTEIGTIDDVVLSRAGQLIGIIADVEGREIFLPVENANLVSTPDQEFAFVTDMSVEELEATAP
ncbi:hypothetical protein LX81_01182 [Palleronia aestuarii]|uniref:PRC-barrel domain protein n=1 Tax=Palleronia aestuarii TaxID=568105 RepID=A0A2W7NED6_9RHOB|nr:hypothetical protein [Palleronia aestuarii]PZX18548.1 hypothetical protein LX81_01182 [Palleronia aestuarii]